MIVKKKEATGEQFIIIACVRVFSVTTIGPPDHRELSCGKLRNNRLLYCTELNALHVSTKRELRGTLRGVPFPI